MDFKLLSWTGFILSNTHAEIDGLKYEDGPKWIFVMYEMWLNNSDMGKKIKEENGDTIK
jgi:hypothetical protein